MELFSSTPDELEAIWLKALDVRGVAQVAVDDFVEFMENLARGSMSEEPTAVSINFSKEMMQMMQIEGCVDGKEDKQYIDIKVLRHKIKQEQTIDIDVFNQLLSQNCEFRVES